MARAVEVRSQRSSVHKEATNETSEETGLDEETSIDLLICSKGKIEGLTNELDLINSKYFVKKFEHTVLLLRISVFTHLEVGVILNYDRNGLRAV